LITLSVRQLNADALVAVAVRTVENVPLLRQSGAHDVHHVLGGSRLTMTVESRFGSATAGERPTVRDDSRCLAVFGEAWPRQLWQKLLKSEPTLLPRHGRLLPSALRRQRVTDGEIRQAIRARGIATDAETAGPDRRVLAVSRDCHTDAG
jgi:hypothetical protein